MNGQNQQTTQLLSGVVANEVNVASKVGGMSLAPQSLGEVVKFAEVMAKADIALPKHLRGNPGACMAVAMQALEWEMSPFAVASKSYSVGDRISYEAQLIAAVVNTRSPIEGRLRYEFSEEGDDLQCTVTGIIDGQECVYISPPISQIRIKNSPLWVSDPQQQLGYYSARAWARRYVPEVMLGVYDREEAESHQGPDHAKDVTPSVMDRLKGGLSNRQARTEPQEGFGTIDLDAETSSASEPETKQDNPSPADELSDLPSDDPAAAEVEPEEQPSPSQTSGSTPIENSEHENHKSLGDALDGGADQRTQEDAGQFPKTPPASSTDQAANIEFLKYVFNRLYASRGPDLDVFKGTGAALQDEIGAENETTKAKCKTLYVQVKRLCGDEPADAADVLVYCAGVIGVEDRDLLQSEAAQ